MPDAVLLLPHLNAALNACAALLLVWGYVCIRRRQTGAHKQAMLASFAVSMLFMISYAVYHMLAGSKRFPAAAPTWVRALYLTVLLTHVLLAAAVPWLAMVTIYLGLRDRRTTHRRLARWTFPIWLYVSVTGVLVYLMLYHWFGP